MGLELWNLLT